MHPQQLREGGKLNSLKQVQDLDLQIKLSEESLKVSETSLKWFIISTTKNLTEYSIY